jgi:hypothetical protein
LSCAELRIILKWIIKEGGCQVVGWIHMAEDREKSRAFLKMVEKFEFCKMRDIS